MGWWEDIKGWYTENPIVVASMTGIALGALVGAGLYKYFRRTDFYHEAECNYAVHSLNDDKTRSFTDGQDLIDLMAILDI